MHLALLSKNNNRRQKNFKIEEPEKKSSIHSKLSVGTLKSNCEFHPITLLEIRKNFRGRQKQIGFKTT